MSMMQQATASSSGSYKSCSPRQKYSHPLLGHYCIVKEVCSTLDCRSDELKRLKPRHPYWAGDLHCQSSASWKNECLPCAMRMQQFSTEITQCPTSFSEEPCAALHLVEPALSSLGFRLDRCFECCPTCLRSSRLTSWP